MECSAQDGLYRPFRPHHGILNPAFGRTGEFEEHLKRRAIFRLFFNKWPGELA